MESMKWDTRYKSQWQFRNRGYRGWSI